MPINFKIVLPGQLYRSGQIAPSEIPTLIKTPYNVVRIVSLDQSAGTAISSYIPQGIEHIIFPLLESSGSIESRSLANSIKQGLLNAKGPVLVHCVNGQDRTGLAIALYRTIKQGWSCTQAIQEAKSEGYGSGLSADTLSQYNSEICSTCQVSHAHYCQAATTPGTTTGTTPGATTTGTTDISQADDIVTQMRDDFSHQAGWSSAGVIPPGTSTEYSFSFLTSPSTEGPLGAKSGSIKARKSILKKIVKIIEDKELKLKDNNEIDIPLSGQIDNYGGSSAGNAPSGTPGSPNSAAFTADPTGLVQL